MTSAKPFRFAAVGQGSSRTDWTEAARKLEALGYSTLVVGEHISISHLGFASPIASLMAAASATTSLRVSSQAFTNGLRHPALLAQEAATIDLLSDGRLELGIGAGWLGSDFEALGLPFEPPRERVERLREAVILIKRLFGVEPVTHEGRYYRVLDLDLFPKPAQRPHPPIFLGGGGQRILSLAAQEASIVGLDIAGTVAGTLNLATISAEATDKKVSWIRRAAGSRYDALELSILVHHVIVTTDRDTAARQIAAEWAAMPETLVRNADMSIEQVLDSPHALVGTVDQIVEELQARRDRYGISYLVVRPDYVDVMAPVVERLAGT